MVRRFLPLLVLACAPLFAQEKPIDLSVGYPSTTIAYAEGDVQSLFKTLSDPSLLKGLGVSAEVPDLGKLVTEGLDIELTDAEVRQLLGGFQRVSWGLLDIGVGRPRLKMQMVMRHEDPALLVKALARAQEQGAESILSVQDYEGVKIYEVELPAREVKTDPENFGAGNPMEDFFVIDVLFVAIHGGRHILASTGLNHVKDSIDFLSFPEDTTDTLAGNKRFKDALAEFEKPDMLGFINTTALINTIERISGDKGNTPLNDYFGGLIRFAGEFLEYKQLKSIAAGLWADEKSNTVKIDARIQFHNEPAWYTAIKLKPTAQPLTEFVPVDTIQGTTWGIEKPRELYSGVMQLLRSRASESGQQEVIKWLDKFEASVNSPDVLVNGEIVEKGVKVEDILDQLGDAQALLILPTEPRSSRQYYMPTFDTVGLFKLKDVKKAEEFLYEKLLKTKIGSGLRSADLDITVFDDVEIHHQPAGPEDDPVAFAFVKDVFIYGNLQGIKRVVAARKAGNTLSTMAAYKQARSIVWDKCGSSGYLNLGAFIKMSSSPRRYYYEAEAPAQQTVDATQEDENPAPYLADFFGGTVMVWGTQARDNELALRYAVAGWPTMERFKVLAAHFRDVARNKQVRNDFIQLLDGATTHFVLKGKAAKDIGEIAKAGYLPKGRDFLDPFGEAGEKRAYTLADVPDTVDIRQAVLMVYQAKPGLDGKHLAALWNGYIVKLTPAELEKARERARQGKGLEQYKDVSPLVAARERVVPGERRVRMAAVEVIDDDGTERTVEAIEGDTLDTEKKIDAPPAEEEE